MVIFTNLRRVSGAALAGEKVREQQRPGHTCRLGVFAGILLRSSDQLGANPPPESVCGTYPVSLSCPADPRAESGAGFHSSSASPHLPLPREQAELRAEGAPRGWAPPAWHGGSTGESSGVTGAQGGDRGAGRGCHRQRSRIRTRRPPSSSERCRNGSCLRDS